MTKQIHNPIQFHLNISRPTRRNIYGTTIYFILLNFSRKQMLFSQCALRLDMWKMKMFLFHSAARLSANFLLALSVYLERTFLSGLFPTFDFILDIFLFAIFFPRNSPMKSRCFRIKVWSLTPYQMKSLLFMRSIYLWLNSSRFHRM